ncbi:MAG: metal ABC transporter solute-binding protein, Zn/Mn family, partial [Tabrizicola sp.]
SILGDIVANVGGDRVEVITLVGPDGDAHVFQPAPADAEAVAGADVIIANGLGFEGWMDRLVEASGTKATLITAAEGVTPISFEGEEGHDHEHADGEEHGHEHAEGEEHAHEGEEHEHAEGEAHDHDHGKEEAGHDHAGHDHGEFDPHAWQSVANVILYVGAIEGGLSAADPEGAETYKANAAEYLAELETLDAEIRAGVAALPEDRRTVVTSHDAFGYFAASYGLTFVAPQGVSTEAEASAQDVAALITQIKETGISAVFVENIADPRLLAQIASETGAKIGGTLFSDALSAADGPAGTYLTMMRYNLGQLTQALTN